MCGYMQESADTCGSQKRVLDPPKLVLEVVVNHPVWVLGNELRSSARAAIHALNL